MKLVISCILAFGIGAISGLANAGTTSGVVTCELPYEGSKNGYSCDSLQVANDYEKKLVMGLCLMVDATITFEPCNTDGAAATCVSENEIIAGDMITTWHFFTTANDQQQAEDSCAAINGTFSLVD